MPISNLASGKVVATPTLTGWSQAYIAGGFFVAFSLSLEKEDEAIHLHIIGKQCLNDLEAEFFALEEKSLVSIKEALLHIIDQLPKEISVSASIGFVKNDILYLFLYGSGSILFLRDGEFAALLSQAESNKAIQTASGTLRHGDVFVLETGQFEKIISQDKIKNVLMQQSIDEATETLSPLVHGVTEGGAVAIFVTYSTREETASDTFMQAQENEEEESTDLELPPTPLPPQTTIEEEITQQSMPQATQRTHALQIKKLMQTLLYMLPLPKTRLSHQRKIILTVATALIIVLFASIILKNQNEQNKRTKVLFAQFYEPAQKHFDDGQGLLTLNAGLAKDELDTAKKLLEDAKGKFPNNTPEEKKRLALLTSVQQSLEQVSGIKTIPLTTVNDDKSPLLTLLKISSDYLYAIRDDKHTYTISAKEILNEEQKTLVKNNKDWSSVAGLGVFGGNLYVLDKKEGILKFAQGGTDFTKSSYFKGALPDLQNATDIAIDSSIYILKTDGTILKYTRGTPDNFKVTGLDKPFNKPTRLFTSEDTANIYILDRGNGRLVKLNKDGAYESQYQAGQLSKAQAIDIFEKDKKAYFLIDKKIYEMQID